jgi:hypothetical protein
MNRWCSVVALVGVSSALVGPACRRDKEDAPMTMTDIATLEKDVGLKLPRSARVLGVIRDGRLGGMDSAVYAKLEMPVADWEGMLPGAPFRASDMVGRDRVLLGNDKGWWDPQHPADLRAVQAVLPNGRTLNVGLDDRSRPGMVVLYVMNHGT